MIWSHIGPWTWWRIVRCGRRYQTGENHGTPFQISTRASERPIRPASSDTGGAREHGVAAPPADDVVAVAAGRRRQPDGGRRAVDDLQPGRRPAPHELVGVHLGPAGVGIVEVAPGQHVDPAHPGAHDLADQPLDLDVGPIGQLRPPGRVEWIRGGHRRDCSGRPRTIGGSWNSRPREVSPEVKPRRTVPVTDPSCAAAAGFPTHRFTGSIPWRRCEGRRQGPADCLCQPATRWYRRRSVRRTAIPRRVVPPPWPSPRSSRTPMRPSPARPGGRRPIPGGGPCSGERWPTPCPEPLSWPAPARPACARSPDPRPARARSSTSSPRGTALWYFEVVRHGYPRHVPANVTYFDPEARTAFFPALPAAGAGGRPGAARRRRVRRLAVNLVLGAVVVLLAGLIARRLYGERVAAPGHGPHGRLPRQLRAVVRLQRGADAGARRRLPAAAARRALAAGRPGRRARHRQPTQRRRHLRRLCAWRPSIAIARRRDWRALLAPVLAPLGWIAFQLFLAHQHRRARRVVPRPGRGVGARGRASAAPPCGDIGNAVATRSARPPTSSRCCASSPCSSACGPSGSAAPAAGHRLHPGDPRPDAAPVDGHRSPPLPVHRVPAADRRGRRLARRRRPGVGPPVAAAGPGWWP